MIKKTVSIILAAGMSLALLAGCGGSSQKPADEQQAADATEQTADATDQAADATEQAADASEQDADAAADTAQGDNPFANSFVLPASKYSATWDCPYTGFSVAVPEDLKNRKGQFFPADVGDGGYDTGVYEGHIHYLARTDEEVAELDDYLKDHADLQYDDTEALEEYQQKVNSFYENRNFATLVIIGIKNNMKFEDVLNSDYAYIPTLETGEIGSAGDYDFYYLIPDYAEQNDLIKEALPEDLYAEFVDVYAHAADMLPSISLKEPAKTSSLPDEGDTLSFETTDLDGNAVSSADLFAGHQVTMINLWATWCGPCVGELPELAELSAELEEKNCQIVGICLDADKGADSIETAKSILTQNGVTYTNLVTTQEINSQLPATSIPTTFFVDSEGKILTDPVVGAYPNKYRENIETLLKTEAE